MLLGLALTATAAAPALADSSASPIAPPSLAELSRISASHAASVRADFINFRFRNHGPTSVSAAYVPRSGLIQDASGKHIRVIGFSFVKVVIRGASAHQAPNDLFFRTRNILEIKKGGDFEGVVTYYVGLLTKPRGNPRPLAYVQGRNAIIVIPSRF